MTRDEAFMKEALKEAHKAYALGEIPIGCVLVQGEKIIARAHNQVELLQDATAHAEMLAITMGASYVENWRLAKTTLYVTIEPCCMCAGALFLARVERLVYGAKEPRFGAHGSLIDLFSTPHPTHTLSVEGGVLSEEASALMKEFFADVRRRKVACTSIA